MPYSIKAILIVEVNAITSQCTTSAYSLFLFMMLTLIFTRAPKTQSVKNYPTNI